MAFCSNCGTELLGSMTKCPKCGYNTITGQIDQQYLDTLEKSREKDSAPVRNTIERVPPYPAGGLIAWAIITLLLCTIPGIVAIVQATGINNCVTVEEQQKKINSTKIWCTVGTVLAVVYLFIALVGA